MKNKSGNLAEEKHQDLQLHVVFGCSWAALWYVTNATTTWRIGLLSDDYDFIGKTDRVWYLPFDSIHWSPLLHGLFRTLKAGLLSAQGAHVIISVVHGAVCLLLCALLRRGLGLPIWLAWLGATLWAVSPAAAESVYWLCASGYVFVCLALLPALFLAIEPSEWGWRQGAALATLQALACFAWDWAVVLTPVTLLLMMITQPTHAKRSAKFLGPAAGVWLLYLLGRKSLGVSVGYGWLPYGVLRAAKDLFLAPGVIFSVDLPQSLRIASSVICWGLMFNHARRDRLGAGLIAAFVFLQMPSLISGVLQARYLYVSGPVLYIVMLRELAVLMCNPRLRPGVVAACCLLILWQARSYTARAGDWREASLQAKALSESIRAYKAGNNLGEIALLDVPDSYGHPEFKWRPFLWRRGWDTQVPNSTRVYSERFLNAEKMSGTSVVDVSSSNLPLIEVITLGDVRRPHYAIRLRGHEEN